MDDNMPGPSSRSNNQNAPQPLQGPAAAEEDTSNSSDGTPAEQVVSNKLIMSQVTQHLLLPYVNAETLQNFMLSFLEMQTEVRRTLSQTRLLEIRREYLTDAVFVNNVVLENSQRAAHFLLYVYNLGCRPTSIDISDYSHSDNNLLLETVRVLAQETTKLVFSHLCISHPHCANVVADALQLEEACGICPGEVLATLRSQKVIKQLYVNSKCFDSACEYLNQEMKEVPTVDVAPDVAAEDADASNASEDANVPAANPPAGNVADDDDDEPEYNPYPYCFRVFDELKARFHRFRVDHITFLFSNTLLINHHLLFAFLRTVKPNKVTFSAGPELGNSEDGFFRRDWVEDPADPVKPFVPLIVLEYEKDTLPSADKIEMGYRGVQRYVDMDAVSLIFHLEPIKPLLEFITDCCEKQQALHLPTTVTIRVCARRSEIVNLRMNALRNSRAYFYRIDSVVVEEKWHKVTVSTAVGKMYFECVPVEDLVTVEKPSTVAAPVSAEAQPAVAVDTPGSLPV